MSLQFGSADRTSFASVLVTNFAGGTIKFFSGAVPANCAAADPTGLLASGTLPSPALTASAGVASKSGTWSLVGSAAGNVACFRIYDSTGTTCHAQGTVTATGGGGDMTVDNINIATSQNLTVATFTITFGNA